ncbi:hypothetical protein SAMN05421747_102271 [Parapedobacter composti]|uniref:Uncharacterized protein n=1 Tax=Parapedobacter composti TaxID=623281 RepID=A0A1I1F7B2_9SPHI|nr:hypothetical protein SAMN05421747_102271 [Parapedobacter composti]
MANSNTYAINYLFQKAGCKNKNYNVNSQIVIKIRLTFNNF